jgi:squalene-hopene/tetraprenyl-beta-curcumene cyclase
MRLMGHRRATFIAAFACLLATGLGARAQQEVAPRQPPSARDEDAPGWNVQQAASYLDNRLEWWLKWPNAARDHDTACVSCHTAVPYALARPSLRSALGETGPSATERKLHDNVLKRVRLWKDVAPFYPDQTVGLPKTSESRGTEAILNALILSTRDSKAGTLSDDTRLAFDNLWALQFRKGDLTGAWAWLNFHLEPWESTGAAYYGATLAAIAVGAAPGNYAANPEIQTQLALLSNYLRRGATSEPDFNRVMLLWASSTLPALLTPDQQRDIGDAVLSKQQDDGGWTMSTLGSWKRSDSSAPDSNSDGYATGLVLMTLQRSGLSKDDARIRKGLAWLVQHQDAASGMWSSSSLNKQRDPASDIGKFMSDVATAYAVLALTR